MNLWQPIRELMRLPSLAYRVASARPGKMKEDQLFYGKHERQYVRVFQPLEDRPERELIIYFIHGGGWRFGSPEWSRSLAYLFTELGYEVVMPAYRLIPDFHAGNLKKDSLRAFSLSRKLPFAKGKRFLIIGESAGGNLGALLIYDRAGLQKIGASQKDFAGFISIAGVLDLDQMPDSPVLKSFAGPREGKLYAKANPINYLQPIEDVPVLLVHGTRDGLVPYKVAMSFYERLEQIQPGLAELYTLRGASHMEACNYWFLEMTPLTEKILHWIAEVEEKGK